MSLFDSFTSKIGHLSLIFIIFKHFVFVFKSIQKNFIYKRNKTYLIYNFLIENNNPSYYSDHLQSRIITEKVDKEIKYRSNIYFLK